MRKPLGTTCLIPRCGDRPTRDHCRVRRAEADCRVRAQDRARENRPLFDGQVRDCRLFGSFVVASVAAGFAVHQAIGADADVDHRLAEAAILLARAGALGLLALSAAIFGGTGSWGHDLTVTPRTGARNVTLVTADALVLHARARPRRASFALPYNSLQ